MRSPRRVTCVTLPSSGLREPQLIANRGETMRADPYARCEARQRTVALAPRYVGLEISYMLPLARKSPPKTTGLGTRD